MVPPPSLSACRANGLPRFVVNVGRPPWPRTRGGLPNGGPPQEAVARSRSPRGRDQGPVPALVYPPGHLFLVCAVPARHLGLLGVADPVGRPLELGAAHPLQPTGRPLPGRAHTRHTLRAPRAGDVRDRRFPIFVPAPPARPRVLPRAGQGRPEKDEAPGGEEAVDGASGFRRPPLPAVPRPARSSPSVASRRSRRCRYLGRYLGPLPPGGR
jgi:hypothetical protein